MPGTEKLPVLSFEWKGHFNRLHAPKGQPYPITCSCIVVNCIIVHHCHCKGLCLRLVISGLVTLFKCPITQCDQWKMGFAGGQIWSANEGRDSSGLRTGPFVNQLVEIFWSNTIQKTIRKMKITLFLLNSIITDTKKYSRNKIFTPFQIQMWRVFLTRFEFIIFAHSSFSFNEIQLKEVQLYTW